MTESTTNFEYLLQRRSEIDHAVLVGHDPKETHPFLIEEEKRGVHMYVVGVSGTGKSRFLENLICQDIRKGHSLCLIDPMGDLFTRVQEYVADGLESATTAGFDLDDLLPEYVFLDAKDDANPIRINPLEPNDVESVEQQVDDLMIAVERLLGSMEERVRLRNILRGVFRVTAELNRLPVEKRPVLPAQFRKHNRYPLNLFFAVDFLLMSDAQRENLLAALPEKASLRFRRQYATFFAANPPAEQSRLIQSSMNVFQYLLDDDMVLRVVDTNHSTVQLHELLRSGQSLFCHLPIGENLSGMSFLGRFITSKLQRAAYRRPQREWGNAYYLYLDEFHHFCDQALADAMTNLRKFGLRLINAHQSQSQPPFDTPQGQALLETVKANSQIKVVFRLHRTDAETMAKELFRLSQQQESHIERGWSEAVAEQHATDVVHGVAVSEGSSRTWSRSESHTLGKSDTHSIGHTKGTTIGQTFSRSLGGSVARSLANSISATESQGVTTAFSEARQMSVAVGKNWSQVRDHRRGVTIVEGYGESVAELEGRDRSQTATGQRSLTGSRGGSSQLMVTEGDNVGSGMNWNVSQGLQRAEGVSSGSGSNSGSGVSRGTQVMYGKDGSVIYYDNDSQSLSSGRNFFGSENRSVARSAGVTSGQNASVSRMRSAARSQGQNYDQAISEMRSVAQGLTDKQALTRTRSSKRDRSVSDSYGVSVSEGSSEVNTTGETKTRSEGTSRETGSSTSHSETDTTGKNWQDALAAAFSVLDQVSATYSKALQESRTSGSSVGHGVTVEHSRSEQLRQGEALTRSLSETYRQVYYSLEGERELYVNLLQSLANRQCFVMGEPLQPKLLKTPFVPDHHYELLTHNFPRMLLEFQAARLLGPGTAETPETPPRELPEPEPVVVAVQPAKPLESPASAEPAVKEEDEDGNEPKPMVFLD